MSAYRDIQEQRKAAREAQVKASREHAEKVKQCYEAIYHTRNDPERKKALEAYLKLLV